LTPERLQIWRIWVVDSNDAARFDGGALHVRLFTPGAMTGGMLRVPAVHRTKTLTNRSTTNLSLDELIHALNPILRGWTNYHRHNASKRCFAYLSYYLWWRVIRWLRKKYPRLTWKQIRRRCWGWGRDWTSREGTRLAWPAEVPVARYRYRGHRIPSPWAAPQTGRATTRPGTAIA
jgi:hypothetical protein